MADYGAADISTSVVLGCLMILMTLVFRLLGKIWTYIIKQRVRKALLLRRNDKDQFRNENGYSWDYVFVFKVYDADEITTEEQKHFNTKFLLSRLAQGQLEVRLFYSVKRDHVYCKVRAPIRRLLKEADKINYKLALNPSNLKSYCTKPNESVADRTFDPLIIPEPPHCLESDVPPYEHIFMQFDYDDQKYDEYDKKLKDKKFNAVSDDDLTILSLYEKWRTITLESVEKKDVEKEKNTIEKENSDIEMISLTLNDAQQQQNMNWQVNDVDQIKHYSFLRDVDRLKLIHNIINSKTEGGCFLDTNKMMVDKCIAGFFPLHDHVTLSLLESNWIYLFQLPWRQNVEDPKNYFGEKIGFYFIWLGYLTSWSIVAGAAGVFAWITIEAQNDDPNSPQIPYFAGFMALWATFYFEFWKRKEKSIAMNWGMVELEKTMQTRPAFKGIQIPDAISGKPMLYFSPTQRLKRICFSVIVTMILLSLTVAWVAIIFYIRAELAYVTIEGQNFASIFSSILLAIQIQVCNDCYMIVAYKLTDFENHRTEVQYEDALNAKTFTFQFFNSYVSLFYTAFFKPFSTLDPCHGGCFSELRTLLGTIFITRLISDIISGTLIPMIITHINVTKSQSETSKFKGSKISEVEKSFIMPAYDVMLGPFQDYSMMVVQFGYMTMFVAAWPLTTTLSLVNAYAEMRISAFKFCHVYRRPEPRSCQDLGTWNAVLELISYVSVFTNAALIAFTSTNMINVKWPLRLWTFLLISIGLFVIKITFAALIPDVPPEVDIQLKRQNYIVEKVLFTPDNDDKDLDLSYHRVKCRYSIINTDNDPV